MRVLFSGVVGVGCHYIPHVKGQGRELLKNWRESCVDGPSDRSCGTRPPSGREMGKRSLTSLPTILWVSFWCLPSAKFNQKPEFKGPQ